jgi:hypothetical protein
LRHQLQIKATRLEEIRTDLVSMQRFADKPEHTNGLATVANLVEMARANLQEMAEGRPITIWTPASIEKGVR